MSGVVTYQVAKMEITVTVNGHTYSASLARAPEDLRTSVSIYKNHVWAGNGYLDSVSAGIIDCAAVLDDDVYEALDEEINDALSRGVGADVDPRE